MGVQETIWLSTQPAYQPATNRSKRNEQTIESGSEPVALGAACARLAAHRSEEHTSELQSLMRISYAVFCLKKKKLNKKINKQHKTQHSIKKIKYNTTKTIQTYQPIKT